VMILALFGRAYWFLAPASVGTLGFFVALVIMAYGAAPPRPSPESAR
jgi:hypothetical protein